ncbi:hypothetical protein BJV77DRAFT_127865 [Russula vinacea]|nr:hypothetical protein BJV77DRAFT_127865 [Russula vinacea]
MSYAGPSSQLYLGPMSQAFQPGTGTLYPATVLQLLRAEQPHLDSKFFLDGIKLDRVTCVACIVETREYDFAKVYILEDGSAGRLRVLLGSGTYQDFGTQVYVRVMGRLKVYNGVNQLNAEQIRLVPDMHEVFFHCLEAIVAFVSNPSIPRVSSAPPSQLTTSVVSQSPPSTQDRATQTNSRSQDALTQNLGHLGSISIPHQRRLRD